MRLKSFDLDPDAVRAVVGLALVGLGLLAWYPPAAPVVVGALLIVYSVLPDSKPPPEDKP